MKIRIRPVVRCQICYCECSGIGARTHKNLTGHNCWELLLPVEKDSTIEINSLGVRNQQERALDNTGELQATEDGNTP